VKHGPLPECPAGQTGHCANKDVPGAVASGVAAEAFCQASRPTIPSVMAATVGANTAPRTAMTISAASTKGTVGAQAIARALAVRAATPATSRPRLKRVESVSAPTGAWSAMPMSPLAVSTAPMVAWSQCAWVSKKDPDIGAQPTADVRQEEVQPIELRAVLHPTVPAPASFAREAGSAPGRGC
jgi:hypothetical protein